VKLPIQAPKVEAVQRCITEAIADAKINKNDYCMWQRDIFNRHKQRRIRHENGVSLEREQGDFLI